MCVYLIVAKEAKYRLLNAYINMW